MGGGGEGEEGKVGEGGGGGLHLINKDFLLFGGRHMYRHIFDDKK